VSKDLMAFARREEMSDPAGQRLEDGSMRSAGRGTAWRSAVIGSLSLAGLALLAPRAASAAAGGWDFDFVFYAWLSEVHGSVSAKNRTANIDVDFNEIFDAIGAGDLFSAAGHFEARHDKFVLFFDQMGVLARDQNGGPNFNSKVKTVDAISEFVGAYRILGDAPAEQGTGLSSFWLEPLFGVRYYYSHNQFDVRVVQQTTDFDGTRQWADPYLGGRLGFQIWEHFWWSFEGDVAPFGTGSEPGAWEIENIFRHKLPWSYCGIDFDILAGYRLLHFDRKPGNNVEIDLTFRGPLVGFGARF
jgi:hypothetical protein